MVGFLLFHDIGDTLLERVCPIGDVEIKGLLDFSLVKHRVVGALNGRRELVGVAGKNVAEMIVFAILCNHPGKVIPRADALVRIVIGAAFRIFGIGMVGLEFFLVVVDDGEDGNGQI